MITKERLIQLAESALLLYHYELTTQKEYFLIGRSSEKEVFRFIDLILEELEKQNETSV